MERTVFNGLFKDLMAHIYDFAALETHPLAIALEIPENFQGSRGHYVQQLVIDEIENFRPKGKESSVEAIEWRPYLILHQRYAIGMSSQELADYLAISKRQMRRDHSKALQALTGRLWDCVFQSQFIISEDEAADEANDGSQTFEIHPELLNLPEILQGVIRILQRHIDSEGVELHETSVDSIVYVDRIILRQILISLFNYAMHLLSDNHLFVQTGLQDDQAFVELQVEVDQQWSAWAGDDDMLDSAKFWARQLDAKLDEYHPAEGEFGTLRLVFSLPVANQTTVLVIDDQKPTLRMYQRYLSRSNFKVIGVNDPTQVFPLIQKLKPDLILLDVMMPQVDGWEILQGLKLDDSFRNIPVIVCSAWESTDLAKSLGANDFLKKPITQERLLSAIQALHL